MTGEVTVAGEKPSTHYKGIRKGLYREVTVRLLPDGTATIGIWAHEWPWKGSRRIGPDTIVQGADRIDAEEIVIMRVRRALREARAITSL